jgi:hypothetical protein
MDTVSLRLTGRRNTPFPPDTYAFADAGVPINLTGKTAAMDVRAVAGAGAALISLNMAADATADGIRFTNAAGGVLRFQISQSVMQGAWDAAYASGLMKAGQAAPLVYDLLIYSADGVQEAWLEGAFIIEAGVTTP